MGEIESERAAGDDLDMFREAQMQLERDGVIPETPPLLLRRHRDSLVYAGGILLGAVIGTFALLITFVVFNLILHVGS